MTTSLRYDHLLLRSQAVRELACGRHELGGLLAVTLVVNATPPILVAYRVLEKAPFALVVPPVGVSNVIVREIGYLGPYLVLKVVQRPMLHLPVTPPCPVRPG